MNRVDWRNEMPDVPDGIHTAIMDALKTIEAEPELMKKNIKGKNRMKRRLIIPLVAIMCMALGGSVLAGVSLYQQRMEEMNLEMLEDFYSKAFEGDVFHFSRELSDEESARYETLVKEYEVNGRFPEGNVRYLEDYNDYSGTGVGIYAARSTIFLPTEEMSDEELLQLIDFEHKVSYSVNTIGTEIVEGNYNYDYDYTQTAPQADGDCVIAYEGNVGIVCVTEGKECLYLAGANEIERMAFGSATSDPYYKADFGENMVVYAMEEDMEQGLYVLLLLRGEGNYIGSKILHINSTGELLYEKELLEYVAYDIAVDQVGRLYVETSEDIYVYDAKGNEIDVLSIPYSLENGSLCRAKDGKVYTLCETAPFQAGILCIDPDAEEQVQMVASEGLPAGAPHCSTLAKGKETDFIIWRDDGLYTYNLGDTFVHKVMELYEAPLQWEGAECVALEDGRIVFVKVFDSIFEEGGNPAGIPIPESTRICYVTCPTPSMENRVSFERADEASDYNSAILEYFSEK